MFEKLLSLFEDKPVSKVTALTAEQARSKTKEGSDTLAREMAANAEKFIEAVLENIEVACKQGVPKATVFKNHRIYGYVDFKKVADYFKIRGYGTVDRGGYFGVSW